MMDSHEDYADKRRRVQDKIRHTDADETPASEVKPRKEKPGDRDPKLERRRVRVHHVPAGLAVCLHLVAVLVDV